MQDVYDVSGTVKHTPFTKPQLYALTRFAHTNGLIKHKAAFRVGRKWYFNLPNFLKWAEAEGDKAYSENLNEMNSRGGV